MQWVKLGEFIIARNERNTNLVYGVNLIEGVNSTGEFQKTKAVTDGIDMKPYKAVREGDIVYNPSRLNIGSLAYRYPGMGMCIVSHLYQIFHVKDEYKNILLPEFLLLLFKRKEFSRIVDYYNYGSQRAEFNLQKLGEIEIPLPAIDEQKQVVAAWRGLKNLGEQNEQLSGPLMDLCQSYLQELKHKYPLVELGPYIEQRKEKNTDLQFTNVLGISKEGFIHPKQDVGDLGNYWVFKQNDFVYSPPRINIGSIGLYAEQKVSVCSPIYVVFYVKDDDRLLPDYLDMWLHRDEFLRSTDFYSMASVRNNFSYEMMERVKIPLPPIEIQRAIVEIYTCAKTSKYISESAKQLASDICPALMRQIIGDNQ